MKGDALLDVRGLKKYFPIKSGVIRKTTGYVYAVDNLNFSIQRGETLGLVGESGCGKTTVARCLLQLIRPTAGEIIFEGQDIVGMSGGEAHDVRRNMQMVFQDPYASLNHRMTVEQTVSEPMRIYGTVKGSETRDRVLELLGKVGLTEDHLDRYPHEFSGGQRQRICIARALALNPKFVVLDEPTSSTDVSVQAQTLNLLKDLQRDLQLTYLFISHNLSVITFMSDRVAVMYLGKIVEISPNGAFEEKLHPYTQALYSAIPVPDVDIKRKRMLLTGEVPTPINPPSGCRFHPRCPHAKDGCSEEEPELIDVGGGHFVACHTAFGESQYHPKKKKQT
jgi:oligopeptide/dipeptide ABC transporter ATP-binding protein